MQARRVLLQQVAPAYHRASGTQKQQILGEFVTSTGYVRKYAQWLLNHSEEVFAPPTALRRRYGPEVEEVLVLAWKTLNRICTKRLIPFLPSIVEALEEDGHLELDEEHRRLLLSMSAATADRLLQAHRYAPPHGLSTTKAGPLLKQQIPIRTFAQWDEANPGFLEVDLVAHCGERLQGGCLYTITLTDVAGGWTECLPLLNRGREAVLAALQRARALFPFPILGLDTDNGGEFINEEIATYCVREQITFTRGRPYEKRDQCFVEQKNGVVVRQVVGHGRLMGEHAYRQLDELYRALHWYVNCFQPSMKLVSTQVEGRKIRRIYDAAKTPLQRVLLSGALSPAQQQELRTIGKAFDPLRLFQQVEQLQQATLRCEAGRSSAGQPTPQTSLVPFDLAACAAELILQEGLDEPEVVSLLGLRLKPCQWCILYLLLEHPLLSDEELAAFLGIQRRSVRCSLYELHQLGCLDSVLTAALTRWCLCERGLRLVAVANSRHIRNIAEMPDGLADMEASKLKQRGERWLL